jgi:hypothetical protein
VRQHDLDPSAAGELGLVDIAALLTLACGFGAAVTATVVVAWGLMG